MDARMDEYYERLWDELGDVPVEMGGDFRTVLAQDWCCFHKGDDIDDVWHWFDIHHSKGVTYLFGLTKGE
jgi:hypothetical protein